jgi:hypothetical protein
MNQKKKKEIGEKVDSAGHPIKQKTRGKKLEECLLDQREPIAGVSR